MATEDNDKAPSTAPQGGPAREGPGARLRRAREATHMSEAEAARELRMPVSKVRALESDDFDRLPSDTFVRGYLKIYAKLLDEDEQTILDIYRQARLDAGLGEEEEESPLQINLPAPRRSPWPLILVLLTVLVGVWLASAWFVDDRDAAPESDVPEQSDQSPGAETDAGFDAAEAAEPIDAADDNGARSTGQETALSGTENTLNGSEAALSGADETALSGGNETPLSGGNETAPSGSQTNTTGPEAGNAPETGAEQATVEPENEPSARAGDGELDRLRLSFADECWVEVVDDRGDVLQADLLRAGRELNLSGRAPFTVRLGNAEAVSVVLNGEPFEFDAPAGERVLTLTVEN